MNPLLSASGVTVTTTALGTPKRVAPCTVAVTVIDVAPSPSRTKSSSTLSAIAVGAASSSLTVTATPGLVGVVGV